MRVQSVKALRPYVLSVQFEDGTSGEIDLADRLYGPVFEPLKSETMFMKVAVDRFGAIYWPNGADLAPDALYDQLRHKGQKELA